MVRTGKISRSKWRPIIAMGSKARYRIKPSVLFHMSTQAYLQTLIIRTQELSCDSRPIRQSAILFGHRQEFRVCCFIKFRPDTNPRTAFDDPSVDNSNAAAEPARSSSCPGQEADTPNPTNVPRTWQQPQMPSLSPPGWLDSISSAKNRLLSPQSRPAVSSTDASRIPEAAEASNSNPADSQEQPTETREFGDATAASGLEILSNLSVPPDIDIIAVYDIGQSIATAWGYTLEEHFSKRSSSRDKSFQAKLRALNQTKDCEDQEDSGVSHIDGWTSHVERLTARPSGKETGTSEPTVSAPAASPDPTRHDNASKDPGKAPSISSARTGKGKEPLSRALSSKGPKPLSEKNKVSKASTWLTDLAMLPGDLSLARVLASTYSSKQTHSVESSSEKSEYNASLARTIHSVAGAILEYLKKRQMGDLSRVPLMLIASGFGSLIIQRLITLMSETEAGAEILDLIASIIFFDAPNNISNENSESDAERTVLPVLPPPLSTPRATRVKTFLESNLICSRDLWVDFHETIKKKQLSTVWFYTPTQRPEGTATTPRADGVDFVKLEPVPHDSTVDRSQPRFRGPGDPNYRSVIDEIQRCLLLKASSSKALEDFLKKLIEYPYNLDITDYQKRGPLHRAAKNVNDAGLARLIDARPDLVNRGDEEDRTPLHTVVAEAVRINPKEESRAPFRIMIQDFLSALHANQYDENSMDVSGRSPWDLASGNDYQWILDLKDPNFMFDGAQVTQSKMEQELKRAKPADEFESTACRKANAILTQFYIADDASRDFLYSWKTNIYAAIYHPNLGIEEVFNKNLRSGANKKSTCRWIHLPANNEKWVHDLFIRQLRCLDNSTSGRRRIGSAPFDREITPGTLPYYKQIYQHDWEHSSPTSRPSSINAAVKSRFAQRLATAIFMPVLGFETHENRQKLSKAMKSASKKGRSHSDFKNDEESLLIHAYFHQKEFPLHCRRTLDQFTYHMLDDTERRDNSQVMFRWAKREAARKDRENTQQNKPSPSNQCDEEGSCPLLMIDQLWVWVLEDKQTVITSLPNTWNHSEDFNLVHFMRHELVRNDSRPLIEGPMDLANLIIRCSVDFVHRKGPLEVTLYECFQSSIALVVEAQATQFDKFKTLVKNLNDDSINQQRRAKYTNELFQLNTETSLLAEIIDIEDELSSIHRVFSKQKDVIELLIQGRSNNQHKDKFKDQGDIIEIADPSKSSSTPLIISIVLSRRDSMQRGRHYSQLYTKAGMVRRPDTFSSLTR
ncbi:hypothetical protein F4777DRAFT_364647 [Nemania sp. FL0916]|nr:hypothetical protein F4777DRAFT_364647 [Nemania sp. FL0916]